MLGINGLELIVLALLGVIILGPERLPEYAAQLGQLVRSLRRMATGAREQLREEMGPEIDDVDWRKLDPRQYDPRRIIKEALADDPIDSWTVPTESCPPAPAASPPVPPDAQSPTPVGVTTNASVKPAEMAESASIVRGTARQTHPPAEFTVVSEVPQQ